MTGAAHIAVIGGGMAGCVFAGEIARHPGVQVDLYEVGDRLGGLHHSPTIDGLTYDIGAFFFEPEHQVFRTFPSLRDTFVAFPVKVATVADGGKLDRYPISLGGYIKNHGAARLLVAVADLGLCKLRLDPDRSLPEYIQYYVGSTIYRDSGLPHYIERMFGLPAEEIDLAFAARRMANLKRWGSLRATAARIARSPLGFINEPWFSPTTLARPPGGFIDAYGQIEEHLIQAGVAVHKGARIQAIHRRDRGFELVMPSGAVHVDRVISTAPLAITARLCGLTADYQFETVTLLTLFYRYDGPPGYDGAVVYNFSRGGPWKRITDFSYIYGDARGYFAAELPLPNVQAADTAAARRAFEDHLAEVGLYRGGLHYQGEVLTPRAYPIYRASTLATLEADKQRVTDWGITLAGRQGEFEYQSSSQVATNVARLADQVAREIGAA